MSVNAASLYAKEYATLLQLLTQQEGSRLRQAVMVGSHKGDSAQVVEQESSVEMQAAGARFAPIGRVDSTYDARWVFPSNFELNQLVDTFDELRMFVDPKSTKFRNALNAAGRTMDSLILAALNGTAKTGSDGSTSTVLPAAQKVAVTFGGAGNTGLTVAKLRRAKQILMAANVDVTREPVYCAIKALQHDNLLSEAQVINLDYNDKPVLVDGMVTRFLGINFIHTELIESSSTSDYIPVWVKSGVHLGVWKEPETNMSQRVDLTSQPWQAYLKMVMGATRLEEVRTVQISCYNA